MHTSSITSVRLNPEVIKQLDFAAKSLHRNKNWIINQALQTYLHSLLATELTKEAKRQSMLASHKIDPDEKLWEENADIEDWK